MACKITRPDSDTIFTRVEQMFSTTVLGGADVIPESNEFLAVSLNYAMMEEFYSMSEIAWREHDPRYACCDNLIEIAALDGVFPHPASFSQGYIRVTGDAGTVIPSTISFDFGGSMYVPAGPVPSQMPDEGFAVIRAQAVEPGPGKNMAANTIGTLVGGAGALDAEVMVYGRFCGGAVAEGCEQFRSRYLQRIASKTNYGLEWVKEQVLSWPCVTGVCVREGVCCDPADEAGPIRCNTEIRLYAIFDNTFECGMPPQCVVDEMTDAIFGTPQGLGTGLAEWGMFGRIYTATPVNIGIVVSGLSCNTPTQSALIKQRILDFTSKVCPSTPIRADDLRMIVAQILGTTKGFSIFFDIPEGTVGVETNYCGDAVPSCDYKICVDDVQLIGQSLVSGGTCP